MKTSLLKFPLRFHTPDDGGGSAGGGDGGAANGGQGAGAGGAGDGNGGAAAAGGGAPAFDIRQHIDDAGNLKKGWTKAAGVPDSFEKFTRPEAAFRSHVSLEKQIGAKGIIVPGPNASQQERDAFYNALGRPAKPEEYGFTKPDKIKIGSEERAVPDTAWDSNRATKWQAKLHELGIPKDQAQKIMLAAVEESVTGLGMIDAAQKQIQANGKAALQKEWGADYDKNIGAAIRAAEQFGGDELKNHPALGNDPVLIKALAKIGAAVSEQPGKGARQQAGSNAMSAADAKAEGHKLTQEMQQRVKADRNFKNTPEYAQMADRKSALFKLAYPE